MQLLKYQLAWKMPGDVINGLWTPENIDTGEAYIKVGCYVSAFLLHLAFKLLYILMLHGGYLKVAFLPIFCYL